MIRKKHQHSKEWFVERIGRKIISVHSGLIIEIVNKYHAGYLYESQINNDREYQMIQNYDKSLLT